MKKHIDPPQQQQFELTTIKYLVGSIGLQILALIDQGCADIDEIKQFTSFSMTCITIKLELLRTLGLILGHDGAYTVTPNGVCILDELYGW